LHCFQLMARLPVLFFVTAFLISACNNSNGNRPSGNQQAAQAATNELPGQAVYQKNCKICHGSKGDLGLSGAANLRKSTLTPDEKIGVITFGRNGMAPHKDILTAEEIDQVAAYIETLHDE